MRGTWASSKTSADRKWRSQKTMSFFLSASCHAEYACTSATWSDWWSQGPGGEDPAGGGP